MKNVLIIIHLPRATPRVTGLVKYLPEFGWQPIILTGTTSRHKDLPARIIETPYRDALGFLGRWLKIDQTEEAGQQVRARLGIASKKSPLDFCLTLGGAVINYPCPNKNWQPFALEAARKLLREERLDAIISSSAPVTSHLIAGELKTEFNLPWLADLRDLWSQNHNYSYGPIRRFLDRRLEVRTLAKADAITTVSEPWAAKLRTLHHDDRVYTITHGYDPAEVNDPPAKLTEKFTITFTGTIYHGRQNPARFFAALKDLISDRRINADDIEVRFYGPVEEWLSSEIEAFGLSDIVKQFGQVPRTVSMEKQRESQILLLLDWDDSKELGLHTGKLFEYLGTRRPVLSTGGTKGNVVEDLLKETGAGTTATMVEDIKSAICEMYDEYKAKGEVLFGGKEAVINKYTQREMAEKFSNILDSIRN